jgi:hypothetical protein
VALLLVVLCGLNGGCAWNAKKKEQERKRREKAAAAAPVLHPVDVGTITLVDEAGKFVLVDSGNSASPPVGGVLKGYTSGVETSELVTTQVRKHPFSIADIRSGQPHQGDRVRLEPTVARPEVVPPKVKEE